jgi:hypothetical protein
MDRVDRQRGIGDPLDHPREAAAPAVAEVNDVVVGGR